MSANRRWWSVGMYTKVAGSRDENSLASSVYEKMITLMNGEESGGEYVELTWKQDHHHCHRQQHRRNEEKKTMRQVVKQRLYFINQKKAQSSAENVCMKNSKKKSSSLLSPLNRKIPSTHHARLRSSAGT